jgi:hypothetical protein
MLSQPPLEQSLFRAKGGAFGSLSLGGWVTPLFLAKEFPWTRLLITVLPLIWWMLKNERLAQERERAQYNSRHFPATRFTRRICRLRSFVLFSRTRIPARDDSGPHNEQQKKNIIGDSKDKENHI